MENLNENNYPKAYDFAFDYVSNKFRPFTSEDVKISFQKNNPTVKFTDFGSVMRALSGKEIILEKGFVKAILPSARGRIITLWISKNYSEQQSMNRANEPVEDLQFKLEI